MPKSSLERLGSFYDIYCVIYLNQWEFYVSDLFIFKITINFFFVVLILTFFEYRTKKHKSKILKRT